MFFLIIKHETAPISPNSALNKELGRLSEHIWNSSVVRAVCAAAIYSDTDRLFVFSSQFFFPYTLIKFDIEKEEPIRDSEGLCIEAETGESSKSWMKEQLMAY